jgi:TolB-like protein/DNA-binding winged helix-turn-helix (wHTH) protein
MSAPELHPAERLLRQYCFADFMLDLESGFLRRGGEDVWLRPKTFEVLAYLVKNHSRLVTKTALIEAVWPDTAVTDNSLAQCLVEIRRALGDDSQQLIRTVARRGYVFTVPVTTPVIDFPREPTGGPAQPGSLPATTSARIAPVPPSVLRGLPLAAAIAIVACLATAVSLHSLRRETPPASIAVLPFVNLGSDSNMEHVSDGITEEITNALARFPGLRVTARSSAFRFKRSPLDVREIGRQLGASTILEGSVQQTGDRLRVTAQLVNTANGYHLWSDAYDQDAGEIHPILGSIAQGVAGRLKLKPAGHRRTKSVEAYNLVFKARYLSEPQQRINCYRQALERDPDYAGAHVGLAEEWIRLAVQGTVAPSTVMEQARSAARKALQLDDNLPEAHFVSASVKWTYDWDWTGTEREFLKAIDLNPNSATIRVQYARYLALMSRRREALNQLDEIRVLDPVSGALRAIEAAVYYLTGDYDRTISHARTVLAAEPNVPLMYFWMGRAYESKGQMPQAISALEKSWQGSPENLRGRGFGMLASVYARAGRKVDAMRLVDSAIAHSKRSHVSPCSVAIAYVGLGDHDRAFEWLEKAYKERDHSMVTLKVEPAYNPLRSDPRFVALLRRMKLQ